MKLYFTLEYQTIFGEQLVLNIMDGGQKKESLAMSTQDGLHWTTELSYTKKNSQSLDYYYSVIRGDKEIRHEWLVEAHRLELVAVKGAVYRVFDHWIDIPADSYMFSSAFTDCVMARERQQSPEANYQRTIRLKVRAPQLRGGERLALVGAPNYLGAWDCSKALPMYEHDCHEWVISLDADRLTDMSEYKFIILGEDLKWENCQNRVLVKPEMQPDEVVQHSSLEGCWHGDSCLLAA